MNYNLGRVLPIFKGEYDNDELYTNLDVVYYNGSSYVAKGETQGNLPTDTENWQLVAMAGVLDPEQIADIEQQVIEYVQGQGYVIDPNYTHTDNNYTNADKTKLDGIDMSTKQDTLVSGTNIKTINNQSILGSGNITIEGVSDYNDLNNKPSINGTTLTGNVNLATPSDLANKQDTLVSGTNIKTINNQNILGSGNISISGGGTSDYTQLTNKPSVNGVELTGDKTTSQLGINIPTRTSDLTNDSGFLTSESEPAFNSSAAKNITNSDISNWDNKVSATNEASKLYGTDSTGNQTIYRFDSFSTGNTVAYRDSNGRISIGTPTAAPHATTKKYVDDNLATKQDTLVSGTNIKTINNQNILGSGNISISGGSSDAVLYTEQTLTTAQQTQARENIGAGTSNFSGDYNDLDNAPANLPFTVNTSDYDFAIGDGNGNNIVVFDGGNIRTRYFDSRNIMLDGYGINKFRGKKIAIIGDSISTYSGYLPSDTSGYSGTTYSNYYPYGNVDNVSKMWWAIMAENLGLTLSDLNIVAWSGSKVSGDSTSTTNASAGCSTKRITDLAIRGWNPDIVLCFISCNDFATDIPIGTWSVETAIPSEGTIGTLREAYALMIYKIHAAYPNAVVFACTCLDDYRRDSTSGWPCNNGNGVSMYQWNQNIREVSNALGCDVIDLHQCGLNYQNIASMAVDTGLHPNAAGHELMARKITSELIAKY